MQVLKDINKIKVLKVILFVMAIPIFVKILYFINILGVYFGSFLRRLSICIH